MGGHIQRAVRALSGKRKLRGHGRRERRCHGRPTPGASDGGRTKRRGKTRREGERERERADGGGKPERTMMMALFTPCTAGGANQQYLRNCMGALPWAGAPRKPPSLKWFVAVCSFSPLSR